MIQLDKKLIYIFAEKDSTSWTLHSLLKEQGSQIQIIDNLKEFNSRCDDDCPELVISYSSFLNKFYSKKEIQNLFAALDLVGTKKLLISDELLSISIPIDSFIDHPTSTFELFSAIYFVCSDHYRKSELKYTTVNLKFDGKVNGRLTAFNKYFLTVLSPIKFREIRHVMMDVPYFLEKGIDLKGYRLNESSIASQEHGQYQTRLYLKGMDADSSLMIDELFEAEEEKENENESLVS